MTRAEDLGAFDERQLRTVLRQQHDEMRVAGNNPLEALGLIADRLSNPAKRLKMMNTDERGVLDPAIGMLFAAALQTFLTDDLRATFGQYLTPEPVADLVAQEVSIRVGQGASILDPFGGSGILLEALRRSGFLGPLKSIEINATVAKVAQAMNDLGSFGITSTVADAFEMWREGRLPVVDAVVMNPPFGAKLATLPSSEIAHLFQSSALGSIARPPVEVVALELASSCVKEHGGMIVAVLPQSVLTNSSLAKFRSQFFSTHVLEAVTSLPEDTFAPYKGVAKACVCVISRQSPSSERQLFRVAHPRSAGYDATGRPTGASDILDTTNLSWGELSPDGHLQLTGQDHEVEGYRLGEIADVIRGRNPGASNYVPEDGDGPYLLKVGSLSGSVLTWPARKRSRLTKEWFDRQGKAKLQLGDICLTAAAHKPSYIGLKVDVVLDLPPSGAVASAELLVVRLRPDSPIHPAALLMFLRSREGYQAMQSLIRGSTAHLYPKDLESIQVPASLELIDADELHAELLAASEAQSAAIALHARAMAMSGLDFSHLNVTE